MLLALGIVAALLEVARGGEGQVVDAAMVDGAALLMAPFFAAAPGRVVGAAGHEPPRLRRPVLRHLRVRRRRVGGRRRPRAAVLRRAARRPRPRSAPPCPTATTSRSGRRCAALFAADVRVTHPGRVGRRVRDRDACVAPVLSLLEAPGAPAPRRPATFTELDGVVHPSPAPRFARDARRHRRPALHRRRAHPVRPSPTGAIDPTRFEALGSDGTIVASPLGR